MTLPPHLLRTVCASCLAVWLVACASDGTEAPAPSIRKVLAEKKKEKEDSKAIPVIKSEPIAPDPDKALENYKKLLAMKPDSETQAEAQRRLADLQVQNDDLKGGGAES